MSQLKEIRDELKALKPSATDLRVFAVILAAIFGFVGWRVFDGRAPWNALAYAAAAAALALGAFARTSLLGTYRVWMALAIALGSVVMRVLLSAIYVALLLPIGLVMRALGKDPMRRKLEPDAPTYWLPVAPAADRSSYLRKF